jgi:hypothetical protein
MGSFKYLLERGVYHLKRGVQDFEEWSGLMVSEEGIAVQYHLEKIFQWSLVAASIRAGPQKMKINCWEFHGCVSGGKHNDRLSTCPAYIETRMNGIHGGVNGGRACWIVAGETCRSNMQKSGGRIPGSCQSCDFFKLVVREEGIDFVIPDKILRTLII